MKLKKIRIFVACFFCISAVALLVGWYFLHIELESFRGITFVYQENQFIGTVREEYPDLTLYIVDSSDSIERSVNQSVSIRLENSQGEQIQVESFDIDIVRKASVFSPFTVFRLSLTLELELENDEIKTMDRLVIDQSLSFEIGKATFQQCDNVELPDVLTSVSAFLPHYEYYNFQATNRTKEVIIVKGLFYYENGEVKNGLKTDVTVEPGSTADLSFVTGFTNNRHTLKPFLVFSQNGNIYWKPAIVATEYALSFSKDEILKYIKEMTAEDR